MTCFNVRTGANNCASSHVSGSKCGGMGPVSKHGRLVGGSSLRCKNDRHWLHTSSILVPARHKLDQLYGVRITCITLSFMNVHLQNKGKAYAIIATNGFYCCALPCASKYVASGCRQYSTPPISVFVRLGRGTSGVGGKLHSSNCKPGRSSTGIVDT